MWGRVGWGGVENGSQTHRQMEAISSHVGGAGRAGGRPIRGGPLCLQAAAPKPHAGPRRSSCLCLFEGAGLGAFLKRARCLRAARWQEEAAGEGWASPPPPPSPGPGWPCPGLGWGAAWTRGLLAFHIICLLLPQSPEVGSL